MNSLIRELRRRRVFRTAALYVVGAWLVLQIADVSFPGFGIPEAAIGALIWAPVIGFPVAIVFGWFFDVGPDGMLRVGGCSIAELAEEYGTPVFVYDELHLRDRCREAVAAFFEKRPADSAAARSLKNSMLSGRGVRAGQPGRQATPVVRTASTNTPS